MRPPSPPFQDVAIYRLESTGALRPEDIILTAIEVLGRKLGNIKSALDQEEAELNGGGVLAPPGAGGMMMMG